MQNKFARDTEAAIAFPYDIRFDDFEPSAAVRFEIEQQLSRLGRFYDRITDCRVSVKMPHRHGGVRVFHIDIQLDVPGKRLIVNREPEVSDEHKVIHAAIGDAFLKMTRQLEDFVRNRRSYNSTKPPTPEEPSDDLAELPLDD